ncbi:hypothetical protein [[Ruminococcus] torques]|uniref:hypothetical protein n=1 Tax=[Ruminococcus] torques TaxID=33039 RepID=UPI0037DD0BD6
MEKPQYIDWIVEETGIVIKDDIPLKCYKIDYKDDESILDDWALHIRRNYIEDTELKEDAEDVNKDVMASTKINSRKGIVAWRKFYRSTSDRGRQDKKY